MVLQVKVWAKGSGAAVFSFQCAMGTRQYHHCCSSVLCSDGEKILVWRCCFYQVLVAVLAVQRLAFALVL